MPYIGKTPTVGNFQVCDAISVVNGQAAYTLQVGGVNVAPESANHMLVSLNGILQKPGSSFTISGSTMTFASNLATGDVIDFVQILGNVLDLGTPSDDTVTAAKLNNNIISGLTALTSEPADTDEFLISDAGTLKRIDASLVGGGSVVKLASGAFSSNSLSFNGYFSSDYSHYKIILTDVVPASNNYDISMRYRISDSDVTTSDYHNAGQHGAIQIGTGSTNGTSSAQHTNKFILQQGWAVSNASGLCLNSEVTIFNPLSTSLYKHYHYKSSCHYNGNDSSSTGYWVTSTGGGYYDANTTALSGFTIFSSAGNITSGNVYLYGVKV